MTMTKTALSLRECKARAGVGLNKLYDEIADGRLVARKVGRRTIVTVADFDAWLANLPAARLGKRAS
jgi:hypothetical protein